MPLIGYMKISDPGRISSITNLEGDKKRRKKILPVRESKKMYVSIYVMDCSSHKPQGGLIPVVLKARLGSDWVEIGTARCCPLCWRIIIKPENSNLPIPQEVKPITGFLDERGGIKKRKKSAVKKVLGAHKDRTADYVRKIRLMAQGGELTVQDVAAELELTRTAALRYLSWMVKWKHLIKTQSMGGKGVRSKYRLP